VLRLELFALRLVFPASASPAMSVKAVTRHLMYAVSQKPPIDIRPERPFETWTSDKPCGCGWNQYNPLG